MHFVFSVPFSFLSNAESHFIATLSSCRSRHPWDYSALSPGFSTQCTVWHLVSKGDCHPLSSPLTHVPTPTPKSSLPPFLYSPNQLWVKRAAAAEGEQNTNWPLIPVPWPQLAHWPHTYLDELLSHLWTIFPQWGSHRPGPTAFLKNHQICRPLLGQLRIPCAAGVAPGGAVVVCLSGCLACSLL